MTFDATALDTDATMAEFVSRWERGVLPAAQWTHAAHVAVAAFYASSRDPEATYRAMREGIIHFNECTGVANTEASGYHETLTRFWSATICDFISAGGFPSRIEAVRAAVAAFGDDRKRHLRYYDFDVLADPRARREWIACRK